MMKLFNRSLALSLLALCSLAFAKPKSKTTTFELVSTTNVGYPQNELPDHLFINGQPNPCYFQVAIPNTDITLHHGSSMELSIAVNPRNPRNIVATWLQDPNLNFNQPFEIGIAYTFDGGETWKRTEVPYDFCSGGILQINGDEWLSFSDDGKLYLTTIGNNVVPLPTQNQSAVSVSISKNGGKNWKLPLALAHSDILVKNFPDDFLKGPFIDKPTCKADPNHKKNVYVVWDEFVPVGLSFTSKTFMSRTIDGGETWTPGTLIYDPFSDLCAQGLSTCDPNFVTPFSGIPGDNGTTSQVNTVVVLPKAMPCDRKWKKDKWGDDANKAKRFSGHVLDFMERFEYPAPNATFDQWFDESFPSFAFAATDITVIRSQDQGSNWNGTATIIVPSTDFAGNPSTPTPIYVWPLVATGGLDYDADGNPTGNILGTEMNTGGQQLSATVNPTNGFLYMVYNSSQFRDDFLSQIGISTSRDGGYTWSDRVRINNTPQDAPNPQAFSPFVAVTEDGYVGVLYFDFRLDSAAVPNANPNQETKMDAWLAIYKEVVPYGLQGTPTSIGLEFVQEIRLSQAATSWIAQNGPLIQNGPFLGLGVTNDYPFLVAHKNNFYAMHNQTHDGPFTPPTLFFNDPVNNARIFVDNNYRQSPYVSIVKPMKGKSCRK